MATIQAPTDEKVYTIRRFLGVNEAEEGEATLKIGEASAMRNFRVTAGGALQKRPGSQNVAGLAAGYSMDVSLETTALLTEVAQSTAVFTMYPNCAVDSVGVLQLSGTPETVNAANASTHIGWYYKVGNDVYQFAGVATT